MKEAYTFDKSRLFLFTGYTAAEAEILAESVPHLCAEYRKGDVVFSGASEAGIVFVLDGEVETLRERAGENLPLARQCEGESFGVLSVFSGEEFPTSVIAVKRSKILFFPKASVLTLVERESKISENVIRFLAEKLTFLHKKIAILTGERAECRLAAFLSCEAKKGENEILLNASRVATELNLGRASYYRALEILASAGAIVPISRGVRIENAEILHRFAIG